ncbi:MAG TPA: hypothetical protein VNM48_22530 [Chloroflexota bacterium]|nr:hypothetical protein [Chloroflexota bacterium]
MANEQQPPTSHQPSDADALPGWLRTRYADAIKAARTSATSEAERTGMASGIVADRRIRAVIDDASRDERGAPADATVAAYRRDHARLIAEQCTPLDKASTFQHHNRLRSAFRFCEREAIRSLRLQAEQARKAKQYEAMQRLTLAALERAAVFDAMFLSADRPTWGTKAVALRAPGDWEGSGKSKRAAGRRAPTPDQLLVALSHQPGRCARVEVPALCFALFGVRPAELQKGVRLVVEGAALSLIVHGAKVDAVRGQKVRKLTIMAKRTASAAGFGQSALAVLLLSEAVAAGQSWVALTDADLAAVRRAMREVQPGLSPYAYRHARASDAKASGDRAMVAAWMGHSTDRAQSYYGSGRSSSGAVKIKAAQASAPVRAVKTLPMSLAQRLARAEATKHAKLAVRAERSPVLQPATKRRGPRLR